MMEIDIPGFGPVKLEHLVSDFTGTLSVDGKLLSGIKKRLNKISEFLSVHILTADLFGSAEAELEEIRCKVHILAGEDQDVQKKIYIQNLGADRVIAIGNGNNDRLMLKAAMIGIAVTEEEGCSVEALMSAKIHVHTAVNGLDLVLNPLRLKATLRF